MTSVRGYRIRIQIYQALSLMIMFSMFVLALLTYLKKK
ncbi:putative holin-like toxin [Paenibacillus apii]|nr:putative holin-like toxin [Paenibacillus apii]